MTITPTNHFKPSNAPIFPNSVLDIDKQTVTYISDPTVLVALSGVNKAAYQNLSNSEFFKNLFARLHPHLAKHKQTFKILCKYHPNNCWKVACVALFKGVFMPKTHFIKDAISIKCQLLELKKAKSEEQLKSICGSEHTDPNSPFAQARKAYVTAKREYEAQCMQWDSKLKMLLFPLQSVHTQGKLFLIVGMFFSCNVAEVFVDRTDEEIQSLSNEEMGIFDRNCISSYRLLANHIQKVTNESQNVKKLSKIYKDLEAQRSLCKDKVKRANLKLLELKLTPCVSFQRHNAALSQAVECESSSEKEHISVSILRECLSLIDVCLKQDTPSSDTLVRIRGLINSLDHNLKTQIWRTMYQALANGVIEDQWAENHFAEYLPELQDLIKRIEDYRDFLANKHHFSPGTPWPQFSFARTFTILGRAVTEFNDD